MKAIGLDPAIPEGFLVQGDLAGIGMARHETLNLILVFSAEQGTSGIHQPPTTPQ
jgi:hypothetical protein